MYDVLLLPHLKQAFIAVERALSPDFRESFELSADLKRSKAW
jgi:hypothetical protein